MQANNHTRTRAHTNTYKLTHKHTHVRTLIHCVQPLNIRSATRQILEFTRQRLLTGRAKYKSVFVIAQFCNSNIRISGTTLHLQWQKEKQKFRKGDARPMLAKRAMRNSVSTTRDSEGVVLIHSKQETGV